MRYRDLANAALNRATRVGLRARLAVQRRFGLTHGYHPDPFGQSNCRRDPRASHERYRAIKAALPELVQPSVIDIGCNQGYFTFRLAEAGGVCLGFDADRNEIMVARALAQLHNVKNVAFLQMQIDLHSVTALPHAQIVLCLSIYHHWVRHHGEAAANSILKQVAGKARHALVFETGQPDEIGASWTGDLEFMQPDADAWVRERLTSMGFTDIDLVGMFPTTVSPHHRSLYVGRR